MIKIGEINEFRVRKITDIAYMLTDDLDEVFMHFNDALDILEEDDIVNAFVYYDKLGRVAATTKVPFMTLSRPFLVEVVTVEPHLGVFVNNNIQKDFLVSKDEIRYEHEFWPQVNDKLFCILKEKNERLVARILKRSEIKDFYNQDKKIEYEVEDIVVGYVHYLGENGINVFTVDGINVFVHNNNIRGKYRLGEEVKVTIKHKNEYDYNGSLIERKEFMIDKDSEIVLNVLDKYKGKMPFTSDTPSEEILKEFKLSRKAFKRALGHLYKEKIIYFENNYTIKKVK